MLEGELRLGVFCIVIDCFLGFTQNVLDAISNKSYTYH